MSSAKKDMEESALCSHISRSFHVFFHRAKPVTEVERSGTEVHCGPAGNTMKLKSRFPSHRTIPF